jgi:hypothetical protein
MGQNRHCYEFKLKVRASWQRYKPRTSDVKTVTVIARSKQDATLRYKATHPRMIVLSCERGLP